MIIFLVLLLGCAKGSIPSSIILRYGCLLDIPADFRKVTTELCKKVFEITRNTVAGAPTGTAQLDRFKVP